MDKVSENKWTIFLISISLSSPAKLRVKDHAKSAFFYSHGQAKMNATQADLRVCMPVLGVFIHHHHHHSNNLSSGENEYSNGSSTGRNNNNNNSQKASEGKQKAKQKVHNSTRI